MNTNILPRKRQQNKRRISIRGRVLAVCAGLAMAFPLPSVAVALSDQWAEQARKFVDAEFKASGALPMINAQYAYARGYTGKGVIVAVVDSGLHAGHPEFRGRVSSFARNFSLPQAADDVGEYDPEDDSYGHGSHVSGLIGAARDGRNMHGVAYDAIILPLRVDDKDMDKDQDVFAYAIASGAKVLNGSYGPDGSPPHTLEDQHGVKYRNPHYDPDNLPPQLLDMGDLVNNVHALRAAATADIVMVFAAGNDYRGYRSQARHVSGESMYYLVNPSYIGGHADPNDVFFRFIDAEATTDINNPATYVYIPFDDPRVQGLDLSDLAGTMIAVTALDRNGAIARYSNRCGEAWLYCLSAPGGDSDPGEPKDWDLWSTFPAADKGYYDYMGGTSMSAPVVSGAAAVLREAFPYMTARQVIETLITTANASGIYADKSVYGRGLLDLGRAVQGPGEFGAEGFPSVFDVDTKGHDSLWSNDIRGSGGLTKRGAGTLTLSGSSTYTGATRIVAGGLAINGSTPLSTFYIERAGALSGTGTAGPTHVWGRVEPGNSVGTLTIAGNYTQYPDSALQIELAADGASDRLQVQGNARIMEGAKLELTGVTPANLGGSYTLLSAQGAVEGTFQTVSEDYVFINAVTENTGKQLNVAVRRNATSFATYGQTPNQRAVASGADSQDRGAAAFDSLVVLQEPDKAPTMLQQLSGEIHVSTLSGLLEDSSLLRQAAMSRLYAASADVALPGSRRLTGGGVAWAQGFGSWGRQGGHDETATLDKRSIGVMLGLEAPIGDSGRLGGFFAYSDSSLRGESDNRSEVNGYHAAVYAGAEPGGLALRGGVSYSWFDIDTRRYISFADLGRPHSRHKAHSVQAFAELGYPVAAGPARLEPYIGVAQVWHRDRGFSESGSPVSLSADASSHKLGLASLGIRGGMQLGTSENRAIRMMAGLGWRHAFGDDKPAIAMRFDAGNPFSIAGAPVARDALLAELQLQLHETRNMRFSLGYAGQFAAHARDHGFQARISRAF